MVRGLGMLGGGLAAVVGAVGFAAHRRGGLIRETHRPDLDDLLDVPTDVLPGTLARPDGAVIRYVDTSPGSALPVAVLLHGITARWQMWAAVMRLLQPTHRVIAWDMRGFGESTAGSNVDTVAAAGDDLAALLNELDLRDAVVVGHSMGGMELARFAVDHRDVLANRIAGLVFLSTSARSLDGSIRNGGLVRLSKTTARLARTGVTSAYGWSDTNLSLALLRSGFGDLATAAMVEELRRCQASASEKSLIDGSQSIAQHDVLDRLAGVRTPVIAMVGTRDRLTPPLHARAIAAVMPCARLVELEGIGHQSLQEDPFSVAEAVRSLTLV